VPENQEDSARPCGLESRPIVAFLRTVDIGADGRRADLVEGTGTDSLRPRQLTMEQTMAVTTLARTRLVGTPRRAAGQQG